jgi:hypothetical protein
MKTRHLLAFGLVALFAAACGGKSKPAAPATTTLYCDIAADGYCVAGTGLPTAPDIATFSATCASSAGTMTTSCSATNRVGRCTLTATGESMVFSFYSPIFTAADGQSACTALSGTWTPG